MLDPTVYKMAEVTILDTEPILNDMQHPPFMIVGQEGIFNLDIKDQGFKDKITFTQTTNGNPAPLVYEIPGKIIISEIII